MSLLFTEKAWRLRIDIMQALSYYIQDRLSKAWFPLLVLLTAVVSILTHEWRCMLIPLGVLFVWLSIQYIPWIYFLLLIVIPFSTEMELPGGFSTVYLLLTW